MVFKRIIDEMVTNKEKNQKIELKIECQIQNREIIKFIIDNLNKIQ